MSSANIKLFNQVLIRRCTQLIVAVLLTEPCLLRSGWYQPGRMKRSRGKSCHTSVDFSSIAHSFSGSVASPGKRHAIPTTAMSMAPTMAVSSMEAVVALLLRKRKPTMLRAGEVSPGRWLDKLMGIGEDDMNVANKQKKKRKKKQNKQGFIRLGSPDSG